MLVIGVLVLAASVPAWAQNPTVSNVAFEQGPVASPPGTQVTISYDLASAGGNCTVMAMLSKDGGTTYPYAVTTATGAIGTGVTPGTGKQIVWNIAADYPNENIVNGCIKIVAILGTAPERVTNGTFTGSISKWTNGGNWSYTVTMDPRGAAGKLAGADQFTLTQGAANQANGGLVVGTAYTVTYTVSSLTAGTGFRVSLGTANGTTRGAVGTYTQAITCAGNTTIIFTPMSTTTRGVIDNVSIRPGANSGQADSATGALNTVAPTVTINQAAGQTDPATASPVNFTATFNKNVTGFAGGDTTITGTSGGVKTTTVTGGPATYNVAVTGMATSGTVIANIAAGVCWDALGNGNATSTSTDNTVTFNVTPPAVTHVAFVQGPVASPPGTQVIITYDLASVSGNCTVEAMLSKDNGVTFPFAVKTATGDIGMGVTPGTGKQVVWDIAADYPNENIAQAEIKILATFGSSPKCVNNGTFDTDANYWTFVPTAVWRYDAASQALEKFAYHQTTHISLYQSAAQLASPLVNGTVYTATYTIRSNTSGNELYIIVGGTNGVMRTAPGTYSETITCGAGDRLEFYSNYFLGLIDNISVRAGAYYAQANSAAGVLDTLSPVTIDQAAGQLDPTGTSPIYFTVNFTHKPVTNFATGDVTITGTAGGVKTATVTGGPQIYTVAVTGMTSGGTVIANVPAGVCWDNLGNGNKASTSTDNTVTFLADVSPPTGSILINGGNTHTNTTSVILMLYATDNVGVTEMRFSNDAEALGGWEAYNTSRVWTLNATEGTRTVNVQYRDVAGNVSATYSDTIILDTTGPACTVSTTSGSPTMVQPIPFAITFSESVTDFIQTAITVANGSVTSFSGDGTTYNIMVTPSSSSTTVSVSVAAGVAQDAAGNGNTAGAPVSVVYDNIAPTCIVTGPASPTNNNPITFTITFSDPVTGLLADEILVIGGAKGALSGGPAIYTIPVTPSGQGSVTCQVPAAAAQKAGGADNQASNVCTITYDSLPPSCTVTGPASPTNGSPINFAIDFGEPVSGLTEAGIMVTNGTKGALAGSGSGPYTMPVTPTGEGAVTCEVQAGAAQDAAGNGNTASNNLNITYDSVSPTCVVSGPASPTNTAPIPFTVTFGEPVHNLDALRMLVTGGTAGTPVGVGPGPYYTVYTLDVTPSGQGAVTCQVQADAAQDEAGNGNAESNNLGITYDTMAPACTVTSRTPGATNTAPIVFGFTFDEPVSGLLASEVLLTNGTPGTLNTTDNQVFTLDVTPSGQGAVTCQVPAGAAQDAAGNDSTASNNLSITYDTIAPTCVMTGPASPTNTSQIDFTINLSESVTGLTEAGINVTGGIKGTISGSGAGPYTLPVTPTADGPVTCQVNAGAAQDAAGNGNAISNDLSITSDRTLPDSTVTGPASPTNASPIDFTINFSESVTGLTEAGINVTGGIKGTISGSGAGPYTLPVTPTADGPVTCQVNAGAAQDAAGNTNAISNDLSITSDRTLPECTVTGPVSPTNASQIDFTINFTESVTGLTPAGINVTGGIKGTLSGSGAGPYTLPVTPTADGDVACQVDAGAAQDAAGNSNSVSNTLTSVSDRTAPVPMVTGPASPTNASPIDFTIDFSESVTGLTAAGITVTGGTKGALSGSGAGPYTLPVTPTADGDVACQVDAGAAQDTAGNASPASNNLSIASDRTAPSISISVPSVSATRNGPVTYTATYGNADFVALGDSDVTLDATGTAAGAVHVAGSGATERTVTVDCITGTGTLGITINAGTASDAAGNSAAGEGPSTTFNVDNTPPVVTVNGLGITNDTTPTLSGTVSDNLAVASVDVTVNGYSYNAPVIDASWDVTVTNALTGVPPTDYTASIVATDTVGNTATETSQFTVDTTLPTQVNAVTTSGASPTNAALVNFQVIFSIGVTTVVADDFALHTTGGITGASIAGVTGSDDTRIVTVNTGSGDGTIRLDVIDRDTIIDIYSHPLGGIGLGNGDFSAGQVYEIDKTRPTVSLSSVALDPTNSTSIPVVVTFSKDVHGFVQGDIVLGNATLSCFAAISSTKYHFNMNPVADGVVTADIAANAARDAVGNGNMAAVQLSRTSDTTPPTVSISPPSVASTCTGPVTYEVLYCGADMVDLTAGNVHLITTGTATGFVTVSAGKADTARTVTIDHITGLGALAITIDPGMSSDAAGNFDLGPSGSSEAVAITYGLPVGGAAALGLLAALCALSGLGAIRRNNK
jgi:hypothetical protein